MTVIRFEKTTRLINTACYLTMGLLGVYLSVYQSVIGKISLDFRLGAGLTGLMISFHFLGSFLFPILLGEIGDHAGTRPVLRIAFLLLIAGIGLVIFSRHPIIFILATLLIGGGFAVVEGMLSGLLAVANPTRVNSVMNLSQMFFCLGAVGGPFIVSGMTQAGGTWRSNYILLLILFTLCLVLIETQRLPVYQNPPIQGLYLKYLLRDRIFIVLLVSIFLYVGIEEGVAFWISRYVSLTRSGLIPNHFFLAAYWLGMAAGRWIFSFLRQKINTWLIAGLVFAGFSISLFLAFSQEQWSLLWIFWTGFGFAPAWPVLMTDASIRGKEATNTAMGAMMGMGACGGMAIPLALGQMTDAIGLSHAMTLMPILVFVLVALLLFSRMQARIAKIRKRNKTIP